MKHPIDFPVDFDKNEPSPIHLGRLYLGKNQHYCARLFFNVDGALCIAVSDAAVVAGAVVIYPPPQDASFGFFVPSVPEFPTPRVTRRQKIWFGVRNLWWQRKNPPSYWWKYIVKPYLLRHWRRQ